MSVPAAPITSPSKTKIRSIDEAVAPIDFMMPMSLVFSMTTMMSVLAMLNAATMTMRESIQNITFFSVRIHVNRLRFSSIQLLAL